MTVELALRIGRAVSCNTCTVAVGQDVRLGGDVLADAVSVGVREYDANVIRFGVALAPTVACAVGWAGADAGIGITASHNPAAGNSLKFWTPSGCVFDKAQTRDIVHRFDYDEVSLTAWDEHGEGCVQPGVATRCVSRLVSSFDDLDDMSVVFDLGNDTGCVSVDALYELDATASTIDAQQDGRFLIRKSKSNAETFTALRRTVPALGVDAGPAYDGDADRLVVVGETGTYVPGDALLTLFARDVTSPGDVVAAPAGTSLLAQDAVEAAGGRVTYILVGGVHVAEVVVEPSYVFGDEPSGAWIWLDETFAPDGHYAALTLVDLAARGALLSEQVTDLGGVGYATRHTSSSLDDKHQAMDRIAHDTHVTYNEVDTIDGIRVDIGDGWFLVHASGIELLVRITAEARDEDDADRLFKDVRPLVEGTRTAA